MYTTGEMFKDILKYYSFEPIDSNRFTVSIEMTFEEMIGLETKILERGLNTMILHHRGEQNGYTLAVDTERFQTR
jgi:hypothetical protein